MAENSLAVALPPHTGFGTQIPQSIRGGRARGQRGALGGEGVAAARQRPAMPGKFLSEDEAAARLGLSTARMTFMRNFDLAIIKNGGTPYGPPPLCLGGTWRYARESVDEWLRNRRAGSGSPGLTDRERSPVALADQPPPLKTGTND